MNIIIVGCGKVGTVLAEELSKEDNDICVVDRKPEVVHQMTEEYDVMGVIGNGSSYRVLSEANIESADLLIAVTESDERNLLCCVIARRTGKCKTIARVRNPSYNGERHFLQKELGISMIINPEMMAALEIFDTLNFPNAMDVETFSRGHAEMIRFRIRENSPLDQMALKDIPSRLQGNVLICAIDRDDVLTIPDGDFVLHTGDIVSMVTSRRDAVNFFNRIRQRNRRVKNTMLIGGGEIGVYLSIFLSNAGIDVTLIEKDPQRCEELSELLPNVTIINGDGSDENLLNEERIDQMDSFVATTNLDEENILLSLFAMKKVKEKVVTKINRLQLHEVIHSLNLDSVVYPKQLAAQSILGFVRATQNSIGSNVTTLYRMYDDRMEALEFHITSKSRLIDVPLQNLNLKSDLLVACILRENQLIIPGGQDKILADDTIVVVTTRLGLKDAEDILKD